jgi:hypothetical protein
MRLSGATYLAYVACLLFVRQPVMGILYLLQSVRLVVYTIRLCSVHMRILPARDENGECAARWGGAPANAGRV